MNYQLALRVLVKLLVNGLPASRRMPPLGGQTQGIMLQAHVPATKMRVEHTEGHLAGLHAHENVSGTCPRDVLPRLVPSCDLTYRIVHGFGNAQHALIHYIVEVKWRPSK